MPQVFAAPRMESKLAEHNQYQAKAGSGMWESRSSARPVLLVSSSPIRGNKRGILYVGFQCSGSGIVLRRCRLGFVSFARFISAMTAWFSSPLVWIATLTEPPAKFRSFRKQLGPMLGVLFLSKPCFSPKSYIASPPKPCNHWFRATRPTERFRDLRREVRLLRFGEGHARLGGAQAAAHRLQLPPGDARAGS